MVGMIRLPTQSWFMFALALLEITHYIWIKDDGGELILVGPCEVKEKLLQLANVSANRTATEEELQDLREQLCGKHTREWPCMCVEHALSAFGLGIYVYSTNAMQSKIWSAVGFVWLVCLLYQPAAAIFQAILGSNVRPRSIGGCWQMLAASLNRWWNHRSSRPVTVDRNAQALLSDSTPPEQVKKDTAEQSQESHGPTHIELVTMPDTPTVTYNVVCARQQWFEMAVQKTTYASTPDIVVPDSETGLPVMFAVPTAESLPAVIAGRVNGAGCSLYICVHNPLSQVPLIEIVELIKKADRAICLIVILPEAELLNQALTHPITRLHGQKETRFLNGHADWMTWLLELASGVFPRLGVVLPYWSEDALLQTNLWKAVRRMGLESHVLQQREQSTAEVSFE